MVIDRSEVRKNVANEHEEKHGFSHLPSKKKSSATKKKSTDKGEVIRNQKDIFLRGPTEFMTHNSNK